MRKPRRSPRIERSRHRCRGGLSLLKTSSTRASLVIPAAHWAETTTVPAVGEVLRRDRQGAMDEPWQTLIGLLGQTLLAEASNHAYLNPSWWTL